MSKIKDALVLAGIIVGEIGVIFGINHLTNESTYDENGYNGYGYDKDGYDRDGYDKDGYDRDGYDRDGYDKDGYDRDGYDKKGFDKAGYNRDGYDKKGFDKEGYNKDGLDKSKNSKTYYKQRISEMEALIKKANKQIERQSFDYALQDLRKALEIGTKCLVSHNMWQVNPKCSLDENIIRCKRSMLFDKELIEELFDAKNHCNTELHDNEYEQGYKEANFVRAIAIKLKKYVSNNCFVGEK